MSDKNDQWARSAAGGFHDGTPGGAEGEYRRDIEKMRADNERQQHEAQERANVKAAQKQAAKDAEARKQAEETAARKAAEQERQRQQQAQKQAPKAKSKARPQSSNVRPAVKKKDGIGFFGKAMIGVFAVAALGKLAGNDNEPDQSVDTARSPVPTAAVSSVSQGEVASIVEAGDKTEPMIVSFRERAALMKALHEKGVQALVELGDEIDVNAVDDTLHTTLLWDVVNETYDVMNIRRQRLARENGPKIDPDSSLSDKQWAEISYQQDLTAVFDKETGNEIIEYLLDHGSDITIKNDYGLSISGLLLFNKRSLLQFPELRQDFRCVPQALSDRLITGKNEYDYLYKQEADQIVCPR